jgi:hypothetical protein
MKIIFLLMTVISITTNAKKTEHREHDAHSHGAASLNIAFDQLQGKVEFKAAAFGILEFEHQPKSAKDKKTLADASLKFENEISKMIQLNTESSCIFEKEKIEMTNSDKKLKHDGHSDFMAIFKVTCKKSMRNSKLLFDFTNFPGLNDIDTVVLVDDIQKSIEIKNKPVSLELK